MKRSGPPKRRTRLAGRSARREAEAPVRDEVVATVLKRDSYRCQLRWYDDCWGPLDVHEVVRRSQSPGSHLDADLCVTLCRRHHDLDTSRTQAELLGIRVPGWAFAQWGAPLVREAAQRREAWRKGAAPGNPSWWS